MDENWKWIILKLEELQTIVSRVFNINRKKINLSSSMSNIKEWDSIGHLNLIISLEIETGLRFTPEQISRMLDIHSILDEISKNWFKNWEK